MEFKLVCTGVSMLHPDLVKQIVQEKLGSVGISVEPLQSNHQDVVEFHTKFQIPCASRPSWLSEDAHDFRMKFMQEELDEFEMAVSMRDMHGAADALVDLAYVVHGTAVMMGIPWQPIWSEVQRANMSKVRATHPDQSKRGTALDVIKPDGWRGPSHSLALGQGPWWPSFGTE